MSGVNDIGLNCQIVIDEIRRKGIIGINATDLGSGKYDCFGAILLQPHLDGKLIPQIDDLAAGLHHVVPRFVRERPIAEPTIPLWPATQMRFVLIPALPNGYRPMRTDVF
jgi:hypothetical protein